VRMRQFSPVRRAVGKAAIWCIKKLQAVKHG
jgi:hypothetical protein